MQSQALQMNTRRPSCKSCPKCGNERVYPRPYCPKCKAAYMRQWRRLKLEIGQGIVTLTLVPKDDAK